MVDLLKQQNRWKITHEQFIGDTVSLCVCTQEKKERKRERTRADNGTIKRLFWHINWLNLWCMDQMQTAFFCIYFPLSSTSSFPPPLIFELYMYFIIVAVKCQYFNLHPHFHCFGFILLSRACSICSWLMLLLLLLTSAMCSCLQFWFRRLWMQFKFGIWATGTRTNAQHHTKTVNVYMILDPTEVSYCIYLFSLFSWLIDWLQRISNEIIYIVLILVSNSGCRYWSNPHSADISIER